jgi:hypothetical protein
MSHNKRFLKEKKGKLPPYTLLRCKMVGHQVSWCRFLCTPIDGRGLCGRIAPHGLKSKTQRAIARYNAEHCEASAG